MSHTDITICNTEEPQQKYIYRNGIGSNTLLTWAEHKLVLLDSKPSPFASAVI